MIRDAIADDVPAMVALIEKERLRLETWQPQFWRKADDSAEKSSGWFSYLASNADIITLVSEDGGAVNGFLIAMLQDAPPVYNPGGKTCLIDDFVVSDDGLWETSGLALFETARATAKTKGATQYVVVCPNELAAKKNMLSKAGATIASTWWTNAL
ncbi:MAG: N-acetyltransferase [Parvibaculum sp.]|nr:N-acetyltransferase [Parvibaculum sp.]